MYPYTSGTLRSTFFIWELFKIKPSKL